VVNIVVERNYRAPFATPGLTFAGNEDAEIELDLTVVDPDEDELDFIIEEQPQNGVIERTGGKFVYTPSPDFFGRDTFTFRATDAPGSIPPLTSEPEEVVLTIEPVNDLPLFVSRELDDAGAGFITQLVVELTDVDVDDTHRVFLDWGNGASASTDMGNLSVAGSQGKSVIIAENIYSQIGDYVVSLCVTDKPSSGLPFSCASSDVNASIQLPLKVEQMVDLRVDMVDSLTKTPDSVIPEIEVSEPLLDGNAQVTYTVSLMNVDANSDFNSTATAVSLLVTVPEKLNVLSHTTDVGSCSLDAKALNCLLGDLDPGETATVKLTATGNGQVIADEIVTVQAEAMATQRSTSDASAGSIQTRLLANGDLDRDSDGVANRNDAFPDDPGESVDTDRDGIGNNADRDDDGDTMPDRWEARYGLDQLRAADRTGDLDGDGLTNELEFLAGTRPDNSDTDRDNRNDANDNCPQVFNRNQYDSNEDFLGDVCDPRSLAAVVALGDADGDTTPDAALLKTFGGGSGVFAKSGESDIDIATFSALVEPQQPVKLLQLGSLPGSQGHPIALSYSDAGGKIRTATYDAWLGSRIADLPILTEAVRLLDMEVSNDDAWMTVLAVADDEVAFARTVDLRNGSAAGDLTIFDSAPGYRAMQVTMISGTTADAMAVVAVAEDSSGTLYAEAIDRASGDRLREWTISSVDALTVDLLSLGDSFAVVTLDVDGDTRVSVWSLDSDNALARFSVFDRSWVPVATAFNNHPDGSKQIAIAADNNGLVEVRTFDVANGQETGSYAFLDAADSARDIFVGDTAEGTVRSIGVLASNDSGDIWLEQRDLESGAQLSTLTTQATLPPPQPPPPPPPPLPGPAPKSGGGGGAISLWVLLSGIGLYFGMLGWRLHRIHPRRRKQ
jgi:hypothetical protein